jgi:hypothetical protein
MSAQQMPQPRNEATMSEPTWYIDKTATSSEVTIYAPPLTLWRRIVALLRGRWRDAWTGYAGGSEDTHVVFTAVEANIASDD